MKKINFVIVCLLIYIVFISTIDLFRTMTVFNKINMSLEGISKQSKNLLTIVQKNQQKTEEVLSGYNLQINNKITELSKETDKQAKSLGAALDEVRISNCREIEELKGLIVSYTEEVKEKKAAENLLVINALIESDNLTQQLLDEGSIEYEKEDFTAAVKVYKKILELNSSNKEALCFYNASLYYQNPGDGTTFPGIKNNLIPLLEGTTLTNDEKETALNVLLGISREEGNADSLKQYQHLLQLLEEGE